MSTGPMSRVRSACRLVAEHAKHVHVAYDRIPSYAASLPLEVVARPELDPRSHYLGRGMDTIAFFLTLDAINFGSGYFPHLTKRPGMSGYFTVATALKEQFGRSGPFSAEELIRLTTADCTSIFGQAQDNLSIQELMGLFCTALNDLGRYLSQAFGGSFLALVETAESSAQRLVQLLTKMPYFNDVERYAVIEVPFYKRAQLTAADLTLAFQGQGPGHFEDLDQLTIFADNLVPHVLRVDGILCYEDHLAERIGREDLIPSGSEEEVEIRACAVHTVELLKVELNRGGQAVTSMQLDYLLWNRGQQPYYKQIRPRHRTRTVFY